MLVYQRVIYLNSTFSLVGWYLHILMLTTRRMSGLNCSDTMTLLGSSTQSDHQQATTLLTPQKEGKWQDPCCRLLIIILVNPQTCCPHFDMSACVVVASSLRWWFRNSAWESVRHKTWPKFDYFSYMRILLYSSSHTISYRCCYKGYKCGWPVGRWPFPSLRRRRCGVAAGAAPSPKGDVRRPSHGGIWPSWVIFFQYPNLWLIYC
jgi:hypothetical protein